MKNKTIQVWLKKYNNRKKSLYYFRDGALILNQKLIAHSDFLGEEMQKRQSLAISVHLICIWVRNLVFRYIENYKSWRLNMRLWVWDESWNCLATKLWELEGLFFVYCLISLSYFKSKKLKYSMLLLLLLKRMIFIEFFKVIIVIIILYYIVIILYYSNYCFYNLSCFLKLSFKLRT